MNSKMGHRVRETYDSVAAALHDAGFENIEPIERAPYPDVEHQRHRAYIFAGKGV